MSFFGGEVFDFQNEPAMVMAPESYEPGLLGWGASCPRVPRN